MTNDLRVADTDDTHLMMINGVAEGKEKAYHPVAHTIHCFNNNE